MENGLLVREVAEQLSVTEGTVTDRELSGLSPKKWNLKKIEAAITNFPVLDEFRNWPCSEKAEKLY